MIGVSLDARKRVRLGIIGLGGRGRTFLGDLLAVDGVDVKAICDLVPENVERAQKMVSDAGQAKPARFSKGDWNFKNLNQLNLDIVDIAPPLNWHVPMAVDAMKNGKLPGNFPGKPRSVDAFYHSTLSAGPSCC